MMGYLGIALTLQLRANFLQIFEASFSRQFEGSFDCAFPGHRTATLLLVAQIKILFDSSGTRLGADESCDVPWTHPQPLAGKIPPRSGKAVRAAALADARDRAAEGGEWEHEIKYSPASKTPSRERLAGC